MFFIRAHCHSAQVLDLQKNVVFEVLAIHYSKHLFEYIFIIKSFVICRHEMKCGNVEARK